MQIENIKIKDLKSPDYNPRKNVQDDPVFYKQLSGSLERFGYIDPIIWNKRTGNIVGGNQRYAVLSDKMSDEDTIPVVVVDFNEAEEKAANIALNKISGDWMADKLKELTASIDALDPEMLKFTGLSNDELKKFLKPPMLKDPDEVPEPPKVATSKRGEVYRLGDHRLMCGDSTIREDVLTLMDGQSADMVFTDPRSKAEDAVLDLFGGSGSTLIACEDTNRRCFMMELDPIYCDVIIRRWEEYTGQKAERITSAEEADT